MELDIVAHRRGHLKPLEHSDGHFVSVTEYFTLHQTQRHPLRDRTLGSTAFNFSLKTQVRLASSNSTYNKAKKLKYPF